MSFQACSFLLSYTSNDPKVRFTFLAFLEFVYFLLLPIHFLFGLLAVPHNAVSPQRWEVSSSYLSLVYPTARAILQKQICSLLFHLQSFSDFSCPQDVIPALEFGTEIPARFCPSRAERLLCPTLYAAGRLHCLQFPAGAWRCHVVMSQHTSLFTWLPLVTHLTDFSWEVIPSKAYSPSSCNWRLPLFSVHAALWAELNYTNY